MTDEGRISSDYDRYPSTGANKPYGSKTAAGWEQLYQTDKGLRIKEEGLNDIEYDSSETNVANLFSFVLPTSSSLWPYGGKYIFAATEQGVAIINQHRAHACVLYDL